MGLFVNTNVSSLNGQRNLAKSEGALARSFQRLSSGLRINSARDDAAGMAITTRMTSQVRGLAVAIRNTNDGLSLAQTVEGALDETGNMLQRMRELSIQAATDTMTTSDREAIQFEISHLVDEVDRIAKTTRFNDQKILNGEFAGSKFHVGHREHETISVRTMDARAKILGRQARYEGTDVLTERLEAGDLSINETSIRGTVATDDNLSTSLNAGSAIAKAAAINDATVFTGVKALVNENTMTAQGPIAAVTLDSNNFIVINGELITGFRVEDDDANNALADAINSVTNETGIVASIDQDLNLELVASDGRNIDIRTVGLATNIGFALGEQVKAGSITLQSDEGIKLDQSDAGVERVGFGAAPDGGTTLLGVNSDFALDTIDVTSRKGANIGLEILDVAISQVSAIRSDLGAIQNRLTSTISNLSSAHENVSASRSRILDTDFAVETAEMSRNQIIQQAAVSILAQANQAPNAAMSLLG